METGTGTKNIWYRRTPIQISVNFQFLVICLGLNLTKITFKPDCIGSDYIISLLLAWSLELQTQNCDMRGIGSSDPISSLSVMKT